MTFLFASSLALCVHLMMGVRQHCGDWPWRGWPADMRSLSPAGCLCWVWMFSAASAAASLILLVW